MGIKTLKTPTSSSKQSANRKNALKSTGPRSIRGKNISKWNCLQHGLLAKAAVVTLGGSPEKKEDLDALLVALRDQYKPHGAIEEILVERIATSYWRLRRCQKAEVGEILLETGSAWNERKLKREAQLYENVKDESEPQKRFFILRNSYTGLKLLLIQLKQVEKELSKHGEVSSETENVFKSCFGKTDVCNSLFDENISVKDKLKELRTSTIPMFEKFKDDQNDQECLSDYAYISSSSVPISLRTDLLQRYETSIERHMYRAIDQLERLQRIRLGIQITE